MKKLKADYILSPDKGLIKNAVLIIEDNGKIIRLLSKNDGDYNDENAVSYSGILCPGFVNCHAHLELSAFKNQIAEKQGLTHFLKEVIKKRNAFSSEEKEEAIFLADKEMYANGIVAVADICNTADSFATKLKSKIHYHNCIEVFGSEEKEAKKMQKNAISLAKTAAFLGLPYSIVPHASYSVSDYLWRYLSFLHQAFSTIHYQEMPEETALYFHRNGNLFDRIQMVKKQKTSYAKTPLQDFYHHFTENSNLLLVHNIFADETDIALSIKDKKRNYFWCFCPKANSYIEDRLPNIPIFTKNKGNIVLGTDSLASNDSLSILEEMTFLQSRFPEIKTAELLQWATLNGAKALGITDKYGSFEKNKEPGILLIQNYEKEEKALLKKETRLVRII
jgi:aminodeoxyfutalosine deaminase